MTIIRAIWQGSGAQTIVFVCGVLSSAVVCPALGRYRDHVITVLIALGAACLAGDAVFHLLPHALNPNFSHEHGGSPSDSDGAHVVFWRSAIVICSIYIFYLFHLFFCAMEGGHTHSHGSTPEARETMYLMQSESKNQSEQPESKTNKVLIGMMLLSNALHTAADGVAVGAAFSKSAGDGLSTSLAVLFHEIPHAVGTFAIFVSSGLSLLRSLGLLSFCYVCSYVGVIIGAILGASLNLTAWIFAVIAGMFLYITLAEMIPEMFSAITLRTRDRRYFVILQNMGLLLGFAAMMLLAGFEDKIRIALQ